MMHCTQATMEKGVSDNLFVDYRKKGTYFEVTSVSSVKDMSDKVGTFIIISNFITVAILIYMVNAVMQLLKKIIKFLNKHVESLFLYLLFKMNIVFDIFFFNLLSDVM